MKAKKRNPVSRVDSNNTHGWFARVYRAAWVGSRSFADRGYGGSAGAETAAKMWVKAADTQLPIIPSKPVRRIAKVHVREDPKSLNMKYLATIYLTHINEFLSNS